MLSTAVLHGRVAWWYSCLLRLVMIAMASNGQDTTACTQYGWKKYSATVTTCIQQCQVTCLTTVASSLCMVTIKLLVALHVLKVTVVMHPVALDPVKHKLHLLSGACLHALEKRPDCIVSSLA